MSVEAELEAVVRRALHSELPSIIKAVTAAVTAAQDANPDELLDVPQCAAALNRTPAAIRQLIQRNRLKRADVPGRRVMVRRADLEGVTR